ncbi:PQ loop repeat family protein [Tritrichomonas foetus]|uniref:PQ loop repeat family protein n=1 Tax=Tritrichomonas foetus TaxID=1144522 RepID=A0A1J4KUP9_9EUKA|nr:PQ loop repeat family protein [Tritrichomonas foetus]|eukprot:OHT13221.1 PQ loop repeat family protein [Tritrichomonas foetus]
MNSSPICRFRNYQDAACWCGIISNTIGIFLYIPQIYLNYCRKCTVGFSHLTVFIRFLGLSFFFPSTLILKMQYPIVINAISNLAINYVFLYQFIKYDKSFWIYFLFIFPIVCFFLAIIFPEMCKYTQWINTATQIIGFFPYMYEIIKIRSTKGISLLYHHLNFFASMFGILMCVIGISQRVSEWMVPVGPLFWTLCVFTLTIYYDEMRFIDSSQKQLNEMEVLLESQRM